MTYMLSSKYKKHGQTYELESRKSTRDGKCSVFPLKGKGRKVDVQTYMLAGSLKMLSTCAYKSVPDTFVSLATGTCINEISANDQKSSVV